MKRILLTTVLSGSALAVFGQGLVAFENFSNSSAYVTLNRPGSAYAAPVGNPGFAVSLLWYNGTSFQNIATYQTSSSRDIPGAFLSSPALISVPTYSPTGTFEVEGWFNPNGNLPSYAVASDTPGSYIGITSSFTATEVMFPFVPRSITEPTGDNFAGAWNGDLVLSELVEVPEPSTVALSSLAATILLLFRRRK